MDGVAQIEINDKRTLRAEAKVGFKVLGTYVTFDNRFEVEIEYRLMRADRAFWANWNLLAARRYLSRKDSRSSKPRSTRRSSGARARGI